MAPSQTHCAKPPSHRQRWRCQAHCRWRCSTSRARSQRRTNISTAGGAAAARELEAGDEQNISLSGDLLGPAASATPATELSSSPPSRLRMIKFALVSASRYFSAPSRSPPFAQLVRGISYAIHPTSCANHKRPQNGIHCMCWKCLDIVVHMATRPLRGVALEGRGP